MINQDDFFSNNNCIRVNQIDYPLYRDLNGFYYDIYETSSYVSVRMTDDISIPPKPLFSYDRILPEEPLAEALSKGFGRYLIEGQAFLDEVYQPDFIKRFIFNVLGHKLGSVELSNLCQMYHRSVYFGSDAISLSDTCKEVLQIYSMPPEKYVSKELHNYLIKVPDTYYSFIRGIEHSVAKKAELEKRLTAFFRKHPDANSIHVIIYTSLLNINTEITDEYVEKIIELSTSENSFPMYDMPHTKNEVLRYTNDHGWHIFTKIIDNKGFTFRQYRSLCFVDWRNSCMMSSLLLHETDDRIFCMNVAEIDNNPDYIQGALITYLEQLARKAEAKMLVVHSRPFRIPLLASKGFQVIEPIIGDPLNRSLMTKDISV